MIKRALAKRTKRPAKRRSKEDLEYLASRYIRAFRKAVPELLPQAHKVVNGKRLTKRQSLSLAWFFMNAAVALIDRNPDEAIEFYYIARGMAMTYGVVPENHLIPEATVTYNPKKPS